MPCLTCSFEIRGSMTYSPPTDEQPLMRALKAKAEADLRELRSCIASCRRCPGGGKGLWGKGGLEARIFLIAGSPSPGAGRDVPWGDNEQAFMRELEGMAPGVTGRDVYFTLALRCPGVGLDAVSLRRCSQYLAEEIYLVGPDTVVAFGRPAAVALRMALGEELSRNPRAGEVLSLHGLRIVYNLDLAKLKDPGAGEVFRRILRAVFTGL